jgi:hypothetical protein
MVRRVYSQLGWDCDREARRVRIAEERQAIIAASLIGAAFLAFVVLLTIWRG